MTGAIGNVVTSKAYSLALRAIETDLVLLSSTRSWERVGDLWSTKKEPVPVNSIAIPVSFLVRAYKSMGKCKQYAGRYWTQPTKEYSESFPCLSDLHPHPMLELEKSEGRLPPSLCDQAVTRNLIELNQDGPT